MSETNLPVARPCFSAETRAAITADIDAILMQGRLLEGPFNERLQQQWQDLTQRQHAVSVSTCTTALILACRYYGVEGKEVLVPAGSFITDLSAVIEAGGTPVLVDMDPDTLTFDLEDLKRKTTERTRGVIWVHLTGLITPRYQEIIDHCRAHNLFLIEDAAHAHGAECDGRPAGNFGDVACFSFYATKVVTAGTGGMAVTDDPDLAAYIETIRSFGKSRAEGAVTTLGNDFYMDEIRCCVAWHHGNDLKRQVARRQDIARQYRDGLAGVNGVSFLTPPAGNLPSYYQFPLFLAPGLDRDAFAAALKARHGVQAKQIYLPTHEEIPYRSYDDGSLGKTSDVLHRSLCLPMWVDMSDDDVARVIAAVRAELAASGR